LYAVQEKDHDAILVVIDTLRAKNLSQLGYSRNTSPALVSFARDAVTYENAISPGTWTVPAHASMFTGRLPSFHGAERVADERVLATPINPGLPILAEILRKDGWITGGFVANSTYLTRSLGFSRGFEKYVGDDRTANQLLPEALDWFRSQPSPAFLFVNVLDPHEPYEPPNPYDTVFAGRNDSFGNKMTDLFWAGTHFTPEMRAHFRSQYDGEVAFTDQQLDQFFAGLRALGRYDDALIIVTSDHGELLGEHGQAGHGGTPFEELMQVPLVIKYPGSRNAGERVSRRVSTLSLFATILNRLGIQIPRDTQSFPVERPQAVWIEDISFAGDRVTVAYEDRWKLVHNVRSGGETWSRLYDLTDDPTEDNPLDPQGLPALLSTVEAHRALPRPANDSKPPVIDPEQERKLRLLGYLR
jgi:arylsulfatase A-like enzyme